MNVILQEKEIPKGIFEIKRKTTLLSERGTSHKDKVNLYLSKIKQQVYYQLQRNSRRKRLQDVVSEDQIPDFGTLGLKLTGFLRPTRPLHPVRQKVWITGCP